MRGRWLVLGVVIGACGHQPVPLLASDGGVDAAADAPVDAVSWSITIDTPEFPADPFTQHAVTVTGAPGVEVFLVTDRLHAGAFFPKDMILDATGHGASTYVPCAPAIADCVGTAMLELTDPNQGAVEATTAITIDDPGTGIGDIGPCSGSSNEMYVRSAAYPAPPTTWQTTPDSVWSVLTYPDAARFTIDGAQRLELSLQALATPLALGTYTNTELAPPSDPGQPALTVGGGGGCSGGGRFQIDELTEDAYGTLQSMTVRFDFVGCDQVDYTVGCLHYVAPPVSPPPTPPIADPSKVAVTVGSMRGDGTFDTTAIAILTDASGTVVMDTQVDSFGFAQASLIGSGELTVIEHDGTNEYGYTYRGVHAGDHVVLHPPPASTGRSDVMLATWPPLSPHASGMSLLTECGGGSWSRSTNLPAADLTFYDGCRTPTFDLLDIVWFDDGTPQQWLWQTGLDHVANGNAVVTGTWAPFTMTDITVTNMPAITWSLAATLSTQIGAATVQMDAARIDGPPAGDVPFSLRYPVGAGDAMVLDVRQVIGVDSPDWITEVITGSQPSVTLDYAADPVPLLSAVQQSAFGASWTETGTGSVDVRTIMWGATANNQNVTWTIIEPYDGHASSALPVLPANHASDDPGTDPAAQLHGAAVMYRDYDVSPGFTLTTPPPPYRTRQTSAHTYGF